MKKDFDDLMDVVGGERRRVYIGFVMDHSGSMMGESEVARAGFNEQIEKIKEESKDIDTFVTVVEFGSHGMSGNHRIEMPYRNVNVNDIEHQSKYWISGSTPLYDSIASCLSFLKEVSAEFTGDKSFLVYVQTDGAENSSVEFKGEEGRLKVVKMISDLEATKLWTVVFLGQGIDAQYAENIGFAAMNTMSFKNREYGNKVMFNSVSEYYGARAKGDTQVDDLMTRSVNITEAQGWTDEGEHYTYSKEDAEKMQEAHGLNMEDEIKKLLKDIKNEKK